MQHFNWGCPILALFARVGTMLPTRVLNPPAQTRRLYWPFAESAKDAAPTVLVVREIKRLGHSPASCN